MPDVLKTLTGEVEEKKKTHVEKAHTDKWSLKVNGEWASLLMPGQKAFDAGASLAEAWNVAESVSEGEWVELSYEQVGQFKNIISLAIVARPEERGSSKELSSDDKWTVKDNKIAWQSYVRSAVMLAVPNIEAGQKITSEVVIKIANRFREAE